ncbi:ABC transporter ATP-binding protein [Leifsonia sp. PS1209]|uniref:ABC transporter ATP-binding protein n=1 Tax=Leifsonia sp. PS1209 TaxID=2724914 RepID=UPI001442BB80|nr:ABC transporter ATP-binding protein [Leifsonia sp. PS1209]QIZ98898.1 ABC transporter ATP-binding protein [Leifsonia sp. PS1209]
MSAALELVGLTKEFRGKRALDAVDLSVADGSIFGFLGPNGAGKTTALRIVTGLARPTSGTVRVLGQDVATAGNAVRAQLGFLPDVPAFYEWMTAPEFMRFVGGLFGLEHRILNQRTAMLLDIAGLAGLTTRIGGYSRGMKQRLGIAQALINAPRLLLLDEPTSALDPIGRKDVLDMLDALRGRATIFFSSHILGDVARVCDTVAILNHGRVLTQSSMHELKERHSGHRIVLEVTDGADALAAAITAQPWATSVSRGGHGTIEVLVADQDAAQRELPALVAAQHAGLVRLEAVEPGLEDVFVELVGEVA